MQEQYVLIASGDPATHGSARRGYELAAALSGAGRPVTLFLVQNGVVPGRRSPASAALEALAQQGVQVLADDFSLRERGISAQSLAPGVTAASLAVVLEALATGAKVLWH